MKKYNDHNIYFVPTQEVLMWKGKRVVAKTNEGIEVEGMVTNFDLTGSTHKPTEWLGIKIEGRITLSPGVIKELIVLDE